MITLAQRMLDTSPRNPESKRGLIHHHIKKYLAPSSGASVLEASYMAEKFVYDVDPSKVVKAQLKSGALEHMAVMRTAQPICNPMWIEWPTNNAEMPRCGALIETTEDKRVVAYIAAMSCEMNCAPIYVVSFPPLPCTNFVSGERFGKPGSNNMEIMIHWDCLHEDEARPIETKEEISFFAMDTIDAMFLLCVPRVASSVDVRPPRHEKRRRLRERNPVPLIEYKHVELMIGEAPAHSDYNPAENTRDAAAAHHRLHKVIGHFRIYRKDRDLPLVTFIPEHWRGDASLGIVLHERKVTTTDNKIETGL